MDSRPPQRLALDANVLAFSHLVQHPASQLLYLASTRAVPAVVIICQPVFREFLRVASRRKRPLSCVLALVGASGLGMANHAVEYHHWEPSPHDIQQAGTLLPDPKDIPFYLAALRASADAIITYNLRDFQGQQRLVVLRPEDWLLNYAHGTSNASTP